MFLRAIKRFKDGKVHDYWSMVENVRVGRRVFQRQALYLDELNDSQREEWQRAIEAFDEKGNVRQPKLFPEDRAPETDDGRVVRIRMDRLTVRNVRNRGEAWLDLDGFCTPRLGPSRKGTDWLALMKAIVLTPDGFPLAYEVMPGNTSDKETQMPFIQQLEEKYGRIGSLWLMDQGVPTEKMLKEMRESGYRYLVGAPRGHLKALGDKLKKADWQNVQEGVDVKMAKADDGRIVTFPHYVEPKPDLAILLDRLGLTLPAQPRRRFQAKLPTRRQRQCSEDLRAKPQQTLGFCSRTWKVGLKSTP